MKMFGQRRQVEAENLSDSGRWASAALAVFVALVLVLDARPAPGGERETGALEGNPFRGRVLFVDKLCHQCHAVWGQGGSLGPEMARVVAGKPLVQLTGEFWNHTPRMIEETVEKGHAWPTLQRDEMADLLSYLYYVRLFDDPGIATRGAAMVARLRCDACHSLGGQGGTEGGPLDSFSVYTSPLPLAQAMWNAGPAMRSSQSGRGMQIPEFSGVEMADLQAYIHERGSRAGDHRLELLPLPDPAAGAKVFREKRCSTCHSYGRSGAPELGQAMLQMTAAEISGILWNHSYAMQERMAEAQIPFPRFRDNELADLIAYLHLLGYTVSGGDPDRGAELFGEKGCAACHEDQRIEAPHLENSVAGDDVIALSAAMWNHAPQMHEVMAEHEVSWPKFEEGDLADIVAFLRRLRNAGATASSRTDRGGE
jgi:cytochrome c2